MGLLRFLLALCVIMAHMPMSLFPAIGGDLAVQCFFMISGFYICMILENKYHNHYLFWSNRFFRIFPCYLFILIATLSFKILAQKYLFITDVTNLGFFPALYIVFSSIFLVGQDASLFMNVKQGLLHFVSDFRNSDSRVDLYFIVPQAWTLSLELYFYLLAPFLVKLKNKTLIACIVLSFAARFWAYHSGYVNDPWSYRFFPFEIMMFLLGILAYRFYAEYLQHKKPPMFLKPLYLLMPVTIISYNYLPDTQMLHFSVKYWAVLLGFFCLLPWLFLISKNYKLDRLIGDLSYPMYINHLLISMCVGTFSMFTDKPFATTIIVTSLSIILAIFMHLLIERPIDKWRAKRVEEFNRLKLN